MILFSIQPWLNDAKHFQRRNRGILYLIMLTIFIVMLNFSVHPLSPCRETHYGCCPDGETSASGPSGLGCPGIAVF